MTDTNTDTTASEAEANEVYQARGWIANIAEMVAALEAARAQDEDDEAEDNARQTIEESVLSVEVRDAWRSPGDRPGNDEAPDEFRILLTTGGPAARLVGELDEHGQPYDISLEVQDWFKPWSRVELTDDERKAVETFCGVFYFHAG